MSQMFYLCWVRYFSIIIFSNWRRKGIRPLSVRSIMIETLVAPFGQVIQQGNNSFATLALHGPPCLDRYPSGIGDRRAGSGLVVGDAEGTPCRCR